ncbi:FadR family transcriptional regulator [Agromyces atrinae]|uniref:DNA-binding FadR family transcriptional regulator n=1 Tax=Agromyces atrinae TaxID=592376 RepID=A0A852SL56_9MICO|nr:FadR/GntR family transcriptional regulator [Agromyces atrinae]MCI2957067.1 FadR family transcriptional regulator [Agromyces atrinae]NYD67577.1 DNA-binding FadR family transcriptional regulator [Agromyces atrinae]
MGTTSDPWEPVQRIRTYEQVMAQIEERILDGRLKAGDRLPSERELAISLGVSRPSLRESLRVLEALGIVEIRRGGGPDGGAVLVSTPGDGMVNLLKLQIALSHFSWSDVLETRLSLEAWSVEEAAYRSNDDDHRALAEILDRMDDPGIDSSEFNSLDAAFHMRIAESTGNALTAHFMGSLRTAIHRQMVEVYANLDDWRETARTVRAEHREIFDAIVAADGPRASELVTRHIADFYNIDTQSGRQPRA